MPGGKPRVLIIVQNLPVPLDRRVWLECQALTDADYEVSVICPKGPGDRSRQVISGVTLYKYAPPPQARGAAGFAFEFAYCWLRTAALAARVLSRGRIDVVQACNPPDTYWALARLMRLVGAKFVYDQHDLNPEVYVSRFGAPTSAMSRLQYRFLLWLERRTYQTADQVISTNESYRAVATGRGRVPAARTTVVRSGPDTRVMRPIDGDPELRRGRRFLLVYLGIMGPQDGVDLVLRMLDVLVHHMNRDDVYVALLGFGDTYDELVALTAELGLGDYVTFTGRVDALEIGHYLSSADVGLSPDPRSPLNDVSTMNKTMEYMAYCLPVVSFDLIETRVSGGDNVVYVEPVAEGEDPHCGAVRFARAVSDLLDDPNRRYEMAVAGRRRVEQLLDWWPHRAAYVAVFGALTGHVAPPGPPRPEPPETDAAGRPLLDTGNEDAVQHYVTTRRLFG